MLYFHHAVSAAVRLFCCWGFVLVGVEFSIHYWLALRLLVMFFFTRWCFPPPFCNIVFLAFLLQVFLTLPLLTFLPRIVVHALFLFAHGPYKAVPWLCDNLLCGFAFLSCFLTHFVMLIFFAFLTVVFARVLYGCCGFFELLFVRARSWLRLGTRTSCPSPSVPQIPVRSPLCLRCMCTCSWRDFRVS